MIDWSKPVRVINTKHPVFKRVETSHIVFLEAGSKNVSEFSEDDLENFDQPETVELWVGLYKGGSGALYGHAFLYKPSENALACKKVTITVGEFDES